MRKNILLRLGVLASLIAAIAFGASTFTTNYSLEKPADGDTGWGSSYRSNLDTIDTQLFTSAGGLATHIADTTAAHAASAISATAGDFCTSIDDVQEYLDCIDGQLTAIIGGEVVLLATDQTITGQKTFTSSIIASGGLDGDVTGNVTGDLTGNVAGNVTGNLTGNVTGDVTGNLTGNVTGNTTGTHTGAVTGNVTGDVTGNLTGNVTGNLTGNVTGNVTGNLTGHVTDSNVTTGHVVIGTTGGALTSEAQLAGSRGGTGVSSTATYPASGVIVTETANQTLTTKTMSGASNTFTNIPLSTAVTGTLPVLNGGTGQTDTSAAFDALEQGPGQAINYSLTATTGSGALTISLKDAAGSDPSSTSKACFRFRSTTATTGTSVQRCATGATSLVITSGSTLGATTAITTQVFVYAIDSGSAPVIGAVTAPAFVDNSIVSGVAEGGAGGATSRTTLYTAATQTSKAARLIGVVTAINTAGSWGSVSLVKMLPFPDVTALWKVGRAAVGGRMAIAEVACNSGSTVTLDTQAMISTIGNVSSGSCAITFDPGYFASNVTCVVGDSDANPAIISLTSVDSTNMAINCQTNAGTDCTTYTAMFICASSN